MQFLAVTLLLSVLVKVRGHGRMMEPPSRASMWRVGFDTPPDYNDNQCFCGGFTHEYSVNGGKCGICGDPWDAPTPRDHEAGGVYGLGIIVRKYTEGQDIEVNIEITANHRGHFEFKICPNNNPAAVATQECLDRYPLTVVETNSIVYYIGSAKGYYPLTLRLPKDLTCSHCVLQWRYIAGNNWGVCNNGSGAVGCGPQEEFRACADVQIGQGEVTTKQTNAPTKPTRRTTVIPPQSSAVPTGRPSTRKPAPSPKPVSTRKPAPSPKPVSTRKPVPSPKPVSTRKPAPTKKPVTSHTKPSQAPSLLICKPVGIWATLGGMEDWCNTNCNNHIVYCPPSHCNCIIASTSMMK